MIAIFRHEGNAIDYTPGTAVSAGDVIDLGDLVGIATQDIPANTKGSLQIEGVFEVAKTASEEIALGAPVYWDDSEDEATGVVGYSDAVMGVCARASAAADTTVWVKLTPGVSRS